MPQAFLVSLIERYGLAQASNSRLLVASVCILGKEGQEVEVCEAILQPSFRPTIPDTILFSITRGLGTHLRYSRNATEKGKMLITLSNS